MTGRRSRATKRLASATLAIAVTACGSAGSGNTNYSQFYQIMRQSMSASLGKVRVTREQAAGVPYASMGFSLDGGNQNLLVLATDNNGEQLWTSAAHVVIVTRGGRIARTIGLSHDLSGQTPRNDSALPPPSAAIREAFTSARLEDFPELGLYGVVLSCRTQLAGRQSVKILGQNVAAFRVDENCRAERLDWSFTDNFWVDGDTGLVWRSRQHIHPKGGMVETEIFRPPG